jgi:hypothetical protein
MSNANTTDYIPPEQPAEVAKVLDALPGLIGAIDRALIDESGKKWPFVLLVFAPNGAMHATNINPASLGVEAVKTVVKAWETEAPQGVSGKTPA